MGYSIFSLTGRANPRIVAERIRRQQHLAHKFGRWIGPNYVAAGGSDAVRQVSPDGQPVTGAPIEEFTDFLKQGKTTMDIPVSVRLTGRPIYGDKPLKGKAQTAKIVYRTVQINAKAFSYSPPQMMSAQVTLPWLEQELLRAEPRLRGLLSDSWPGEFISAMCMGYSLDLLAPTAEGGRGQSIMSHPNLFVAGLGQVSWSSGRPGTSAYEASVAAAINGLTDISASRFRVGFLRNLVVEAEYKKIAPLITINGFPFFIVWVSNAQFVQLREDPDWRDWMAQLPAELTKHPLATGGQAFVEGCMVCVDQELWGVSTKLDDGNIADDTVEYGPRPSAADRQLGYKVGDPTASLDTSNNKVGFFVGQSALSIGIGVPVLGGKKQAKIAITEDIDDHGRLVEIGLTTVQSVVRSDSFDQDGMTGLTAGSFFEDTGSLAFVTKSKHQMSYN